MKFYYIYHKNEILKAALGIVLFMWSLTATIAYIRKKDQIIFVKIKTDSVEIVKDLTEPDENYLEKIFIKRFSQLHYTYDSENFEQNLLQSKELMTTDVWKDNEAAIKKQKEYMLDKIIAQTAVVERIVKKDWMYEVDLNLLSQKNTETFQRKFKVTIEFKKIKRTIENPFGFEITRLAETETAI